LGVNYKRRRPGDPANYFPNWKPKHRELRCVVSNNRKECIGKNDKFLV